MDFENRHVRLIAEELGITENQVKSTLMLFAQGDTIPFVARYRKEATGGLDEVQLVAIRDRKNKLDEIDKRRASILGTLTENELLTDELRRQIEEAESLAELEDIYLPYRPKRRTRAMIARERGLEPLAKIVMAQNAGDVVAVAKKYVDATKDVASTDDALSGARDIIAEWTNENAGVRQRLRRLFAT